MLLEVEHVTKDYRRGVRANDDVSFSLDSGQVLGLFGHNGAGKPSALPCHDFVGDGEAQDAPGGQGLRPGNSEASDNT
jgi:ABC-type phosphate/phosphonate transport system ATPase subunit